MQSASSLTRKESASDELKEAEAEHSRTRNELEEARRLAAEGPKR